jgi:hypothetical protein
MKTRLFSLSMICATGAIVGALCAAEAAHAGTMYTYDYDTMNIGFLKGQDNWTQWQPAGTTQFNQTVSYGTGINTTKVSGTSAGTASGNDKSGIMCRLNDANYSFTSYAGTETNATLQFDCTYQAGTSSTVYLGGPRFGVAGDTNASNSIDLTSEWGPLFGMWRQGSGLGTDLYFYVRRAGAGANLWSTSAVKNILGSDAVSGDWLRLQLVANFTANGGSGSATLYWEDLTRGDSSFTAVAGLTNINLGLTSSIAAPSKWNALLTRLDSTSEDNGVAFDNLDPNVNAPVPEPSMSALMIVAAGLAVCAWRKRKRD